MATHTVAAGDIGTAAFTLTADAVDTVTFTEQRGGSKIQVALDGSATVWYTLDGSAPTVGGGKCYVIPATIASDTHPAPTAGAVSVKLISAGTPTLRVQSSD